MKKDEVKKVTFKLNHTMRGVIRRMIKEEILNQQKWSKDDKDLGLDFSERRFIIASLAELLKEVE